MSRVGNNPITIPSGVEVALAGRAVTAKGSKGELNWEIPHEVEMKIEESTITFAPKKESKTAAAMWGLARAMVNNMVEGVSAGFEKKLSIKGVGYRANVQGKTLNLSLGFSHPVAMEIPEGLTAEVTDNTEISIKGINKQMVGEFAAKVRAKRPVEPYKGKGVRYVDERVIMKEGKKK